MKIIENIKLLMKYTYHGFMYYVYAWIMDENPLSLKNHIKCTFARNAHKKAMEDIRHVDWEKELAQ